MTVSFILETTILIDAKVVSINVSKRQEKGKLVVLAHVVSGSDTMLIKSVPIELDLDSELNIDEQRDKLLRETYASLRKYEETGTLCPSGTFYHYSK